jgi:predicted Zn-dependent peptidase
MKWIHLQTDRVPFWSSEALRLLTKMLYERWRFSIRLFLLWLSFSILIGAELAHGVRINFERDTRLPIVEFEFVILKGSAQDPPAQQGLTAFTAEMLLRGTRKRTRAQFETAVAQLGATLKVEPRLHSVSIRGLVLREKLEELLSLLQEALTLPSFSASEVRRLKTSLLSGLSDELEKPQNLLQRHFFRLFFGAHPYAHPVRGTDRSVRSFSQLALVKQHVRLLQDSQIAIMGSGDSTYTEFKNWYENELLPDLPNQALNTLSRRPSPRSSMAKARPLPRRRIVLVDQPTLARAQVLLALPGLDYQDPRLAALLIGVGALSNAWPTKTESVLVMEPLVHSWQLKFSGPLESVSGTVSQFVDILEYTKTHGIPEAAFTQVREELIQSALFDFDTATKRSSNRLSELLHGLPRTYFQSKKARLEKVKYVDVSQALASFLKLDQLLILVLGPAQSLSTPLAASLQIPASSIEIIPADQLE